MSVEVYGMTFSGGVGWLCVGMSVYVCERETERQENKSLIEERELSDGYLWYRDQMTI